MVNSLISLNKDRNLPIVYAREELPNYVDYPDKFKENAEKDLIKNQKEKEDSEQFDEVDEDSSA
jgi:hypothetical protein